MLDGSNQTRIFRGNDKYIFYEWFTWHQRYYNHYYCKIKHYCKAILGPKAAEQDSAHKSVSQDPPSPTPSYYTVDTSTWHRVSMPANNDGQSTSKSGPYAKLINPSSSLGGEYTKLLRTNSRKVQQDISAEPQVQVEKTISGMPPPATASETYDESIHNTRDHKDSKKTIACIKIEPKH